MIRAAKTMSARALVVDVRTAFDDDHVHMMLLTEGPYLVGTLVPTDVPQSAVGTMLARPLSVLQGRTVDPEVRIDRVQDLLDEQGARRLAVIDAKGRLLGLLCLKRSRTGFARTPTSLHEK